MTQARSTLVSVDDTPWYHCVSRCVRRAFLCGEDHYSGKNFGHRRGWIAERIKQLAGVFAIDVAGYAVMSNHYHVVVRIDRERALAWSTEQVLERWTRLFTGPVLAQRYLSSRGKGMGKAEIAAVEELAEGYRERLYDLSWFMRTLNEHIARQANAEEGVKGRFWEGRFKSQALLDEKALLAALAYVDLNPIRAEMAETPEASDFTSIQERMGRIPERSAAADPEPDPVGIPPGENVLSGNSLRTEEEAEPLPQAPLMPFDATGRAPWAIPFAFDDYLELVDWTGRAIRPGKRGFIEDQQPKILDRLGIDGKAFIEMADRLLKEFGTAVGAPSALVELCARRQVRFLHGIRAAREMFGGKRAA